MYHDILLGSICYTSSLNAGDALKCTVCLAAHVTTPKIPSTLPKVTFVRVSIFRPDTVSAKQYLVAFALSVRPPPAV
jgi:hypothetical protein